MNYELLKKELVRDEGLRLKAYKDTVGLWTIGVGHLLGKECLQLMITEANAMKLLDEDIKIAEGVAFKLLPEAKKWDDVRQRALVNMAFNLGNRLGQFKNTLKFMREKQWSQASANMLKSKWAEQVGKRANRLAKMIETGVA